MSGVNLTATEAAQWRAWIEQTIATGERAQGLAEEVLQTLLRAKELGRNSIDVRQIRPVLALSTSVQASGLGALRIFTPGR